MDIAVVTGASSGLGRDFARLLSRKEKLDEIWLIARREDRLEALAAELSARARILPFDLTDQASLSAYRDLLTREKPNIKILVCAAGMAKIGPIAELSPEQADAMIDLNCRATVDMTSASLPYIKKGGRILEICSTAAFQPFQRLGVYAASKAFLYRYSKALSWELVRKGIRVTAVCPYWVKDTEFIRIAKEPGGKNIRHFPLASLSESVVKTAYRANRAGRWVSTPGPVCFVHWIAAKFIPSIIMMTFWEGLRRL